MKAEIIGIGTEILLGHIVNTNSAYLSRKLAECGIDVFYHHTVGDNPARLSETIKAVLERSDIVITTGGLGPTVDDVTLEAIVKATDKTLIQNKQILDMIKEHFKKRHIQMPEINVRQAYIPKGAKWLRNNFGTAPGFILTVRDKAIIALPGPPREMIPMFEHAVMPFLKKISPRKYVILTRTIKTTGLAESQLEPKVQDILKLSGDTTVGIYAHPSEVELKITSKARNTVVAKRKIKLIECIIRKRLNEAVFGVDEDTMESVVAGLLKAKTIAIAESCTGGLLSNRLTDIPGISKNLILTIVCYSNRAKIKLLNVSAALLAEHGAVSQAVVKQMAANVRALADSDIGMAITGIAGPSGATKKKPVGLVYIALAVKGTTICKEFHFLGERKVIKFRATQAALDMLRHYLLDNK